jgi:hypothetical protein
MNINITCKTHNNEKFSLEPCLCLLLEKLGLPTVLSTVYGTDIWLTEHWGIYILSRYGQKNVAQFLLRYSVHKQMGEKYEKRGHFA